METVGASCGAGRKPRGLPWQASSRARRREALGARRHLRHLPSRSPGRGLRAALTRGGRLRSHRGRRAERDPYLHRASALAARQGRGKRALRDGGAAVGAARHLPRRAQTNAFDRGSCARGRAGVLRPSRRSVLRRRQRDPDRCRSLARPPIGRAIPRSPRPGCPGGGSGRPGDLRELPVHRVPRSVHSPTSLLQRLPRDARRAREISRPPSESRRRAAAVDGRDRARLAAERQRDPVGPRLEPAA